MSLLWSVLGSGEWYVRGRAGQVIMQVELSVI